MGDAAAEALRRIDAHHRAGDAGACITEMHALAAGAGEQPDVLQELGLRYTLLGLFQEAERCYATALARRPDDPSCLYNHATTLIALGRLDEAEAALDRVIALAPGDGDAWYNRSTLRRQTPARNHVAALEARIARLPEADPALVPLCHALAKEREDLGEHAASFTSLKRGADARRRRLQYRVEDDLDTMRLIADTFDAGFFARRHAGHDDARPLFVVGLPRSGTTLVDRTLGSHHAVTSRGESADLAQAVVRLAGPASGKADLVRRTAGMDFAALGRAYCGTLPAGGHARVIDKTPGNVLYLGLIAAALPQARIIHLRRNPMDACYAMYKTLFRMAYPFSYDLDDLGRYWLGHDALMAHWRRVLPADRFLEVDYEDLVADHEGVSRRLVAHADLAWDDACLAFDRNPQPTLTASAAQVRQPVYRSSVGLWRNHERELAPLMRRFEAAGVPIEGHAFDDRSLDDHKAPAA
ncbi:tetratricopeptide repeat-containing sulfotransferase family protein [Luteimonas terricola]|uniref:Sulfotransferase n=1 Tax=Luteimonas terricola TaxID=645597 RepID=A0ABQ2E8U6_9GAMM|nr:sulfotransferase [Luteimonas terricola]GGJ95824.1 sulfotransferase [Luteimonas terricola]